MEKIILMTKEERTEMGLKGRHKIENEFGINQVIKKYNQLLENREVDKK